MDFILSCIEANREIYRLLNNEKNLCEKCKKGFGGDVSLKADLMAEAIFIKYLSQFGQIYSEESGFIGDGKNIVIVDPIDGSKNFASNIPYFGSSAALKKDGNIISGVVANFAAGHMYIKDGSRFERRFFLQDKIEKITSNPLQGIGIFEKAHQSQNISRKLCQASFKYRTMGALALSLALSHEVDFVLFRGSTREFDIAAGWYMSEDLYRFKAKNILLVSKDKGIFDKIHNFIAELSI
ncbi:MAG: inositol monophosphatase [Campylobacteraceae bacterium]|jgi:myo-inositol-1(or 4)-monophosphatase|nr:inositol monophosphatase [Campylobacteraceae bacterium]